MPRKSKDFFMVPATELPGAIQQLYEGITDGGHILLHPNQEEWVERNRLEADCIFFEGRLLDTGKVTTLGLMGYQIGPKDLKLSVLCPNWQLQNLGAENRSKIRLRVVKLKPVTLVAFEARELQDAALGREAVKSFLRKLVSICKGDAVNLLVGDTLTSFTVVETQPRNKVRLTPFLLGDDPEYQLLLFGSGDHPHQTEALVEEDESNGSSGNT
ncbi:uncharacterized protein LOC132202677 [Neocloeon triangulifer]|uniref:uncharacterized protein LOC132202677 n=1 Tax=Neocloeon triangulifer TaxID=2078957 RepID=UPI00286EFFB9|nr:uncharacterized protein LOC132202677 [Neocloeon triangulifer]XP_059485729.1 uncharacterized protein LOC132202677 [Neocloeon triangulifer]